VKLWYSGPFFRYEAPQAGRYRQFHQIGAETIGSDDPLADAESIMLLSDLLTELEVPGTKLHLASLGSPEERAGYREELRAYLHEHSDEVSGDVRSRIDANPLRAFDAKDEPTRRVMAGAPKLIDHLSGEDVEHFEEVRGLLDAAGIEYEIDPTLVRGLDYYTRTVFAFTAEGLGAQSEIGGGGRYDGLVAELGGPATGAIGWAAGIERILLAVGESDDAAHSDVFVAVAEPAQRQAALALASELRHAGLVANLDLAGRSLKGQLKQADRAGARHTVILEGDGRATMRDMESGDQREVDVAKLPDELAGKR
jgi:histidyl-tRNA synthetase